MNGWEAGSEIVKFLCKAKRPLYALLAVLAALSVLAILAFKLPPALIGIPAVVRLLRR